MTLDFEAGKLLNGDARLCAALQMLMEAVKSSDEDEKLRLFAGKIAILLLGRGDDTGVTDEIHANIG